MTFRLWLVATIAPLCATKNAPSLICSFQFINQPVASAIYVEYLLDDGQSALEKLIADPCELVLCDLKLPGMNGLQVLKEIKRQPPKLR